MYTHMHMCGLKELGPYTFSSLKEAPLVSSSGSVPHLQLNNLPFLETCSLLSYVGLRGSGKSTGTSIFKERTLGSV